MITRSVSSPSAPALHRLQHGRMRHHSMLRYESEPDGKQER